MSLAEKIKNSAKPPSVLQWLKELNEPTQPELTPIEIRSPLADVGAGKHDQSEPITIAHCYPACPHCQCSWITEQASPHGDGRTLLRCWSCRKVIDGAGALLPCESVGEGRRLLAWTTGDGSPE
jgi:hypothetical protein